MIKYNLKFFVTLTFLTLLTASCLNFDGMEETNNSLEETLSGQILIWHTWEGQERETLQSILSNFEDLHPEVSIVEEYYSIDSIEDIFRFQVDAGLGPDILIAPSNWVERLATQGLIQNIEDEDINLDVYLSAAINMLQTDDAVYGLPLSLNTLALYYNRTLLGPPPADESANQSDRQRVTELIQSRQQNITNTQTLTVLNQLLTEINTEQDTVTQAQRFNPPATLDDLLNQANLGKTVGIRTDFDGASWGIAAFGGQLFDEEGRVVLNQGGFTNWLGWLKQAQSNPFVVLNRNPEELAALFTSGELTYYVGNTQELTALQEALGEEIVGVIRLPGRENNPAGPFLQAEALMFNRVLAPNNMSLALQLAEYLTNAEQQRKLALSVGKLPANSRVNIDPRIAPIVAEFIAQSRTAVAIKLEDNAKYSDLAAIGNDLYNQVIEGEVNISEVVISMTTQVNDAYGYETVAFEQVESCDLAGRITMWNTRPELTGEAIRQIRDNFQEICSEVTVIIRDVDPAEFNDEYAIALEEGNAPTLFTGNNRQLSTLANQELLFNLSTILDPDFVQRFIPTVAEATIVEGNTYGIPISLDVLVMYYNTTLVEDPPLVLDDLLAAASPERQLAIPIGFLESYWGIAAFGETSDTQLFDEEGRLILGQQGLTEWLTWLRDAQTQPGVVLSEDRTELQSLFQSGEAGFLVGDIRQLRDVRVSLGSRSIEVVPLPSGRPLLTVNNLMFSPFISEEDQEVALAFAQFMTNPDSQLIMLDQASELPTNININLADYPHVSSFLEQASIADVLPNTPAVNAIFEWGDVVYEQVLINEINPEDAVADFTNLVDATNGFEVEEQVVEAEACPAEGTVSLWHNWTETETLAWQQVITNFAQVCPGVTITTTYVSEADFTAQLTSTLQADSEVTPPDFFIARHTQLENYRDLGLIRNIRPMVSQEATVNYLPRAVTAFSSGGDELYGIPKSAETLALYYRADLVEEPARTFDGLLMQARQGFTVGLNAHFAVLFWVCDAFGCQPCQSGQFLNEQGELILTADDFAAWLSWLEEAKETGRFIFSTEQTELEEMFYEGEITYFVAGPEILNTAQTALGIANVAVVPLPTGAEEQATRPFLWVEGFYFYPQTTEEQLNLAMRFARFAAAESSQTLLMQEANFVPINSLALVTADNPTIEVFIAKLESSLVIPQRNRITLLEESGLFDLFLGFVE